MAASAEADSEETDKKLAQQRFARIYQGLMIESSAGTTQEEAVSQALKLLKTAHTAPKYFLGEAPRPGLVVAIDALAAGKTAPEGEQQEFWQLAQALYGNFFCLCVALKPKPGLPATTEDPNFDLDLVEKFFAQMPPQEQTIAVESSLETLGKLVDSVVDQGCAELGASPAKLRAVLPMLAHPGLSDPTDYEVMRRVLRLVGLLHEQEVARETLVRWYAMASSATLERMVSQVQQFLTLSILEVQGELGSATSMDMAVKIAMQNDLARHVRNALRLLDIFWQANERRRFLLGKWQTKWQAYKMREKGERFDDQGLRPLSPVQFHNDAINENEGILKLDLREFLEMQHNSKYKFEELEEGQRHDFGVIQFPFVLAPESKVRMLSIESLIIQREEARYAMIGQMFSRGREMVNPYLVLRVKRDNVVQDALQQLAERGGANHDYKKPLKVVFDGEEGVDEGGVRKEFFQLLIEELYNEDFGMFERNEDSRTFWFNKNSLEANLQFELFGLVLGLAIYNQVILDVKFPSVVYKKLMYKSATFGLNDLLDFDPSLAKGLIKLLEQEPCDMAFEDVFGPLRFVVEYECFGSMVEAELKEGGKDTLVNWDTREEYVQGYCDWIFSTSIEKQYNAFRRGFDRTIADTLFRRLFREDELELVICGSPELDFKALEKATTYQDGFVVNSEVVLWFWEVVHALTAEEKKSFLQFCTGCDRAPVGGLGRLPFVVSRAGPDSEQLPSVHTCFNHLLIPAYASKEKLEKRLRLAIQHSTGFGLM